MAITYNRLILAGHLVREPAFEIRDNGQGVCRFAIGVSRVGNTPTVESVECVVFDRCAEIAAAFLQLGVGVLLEGRLQDGGILIESIRSLGSGAQLEDLLP